ncbi:MAG: GTPase HflX [Proteobacteria bacterium]|nr:GTPase HflX [Pseudomonadota bacterium]NOG58990.1 GTPase HflX [Pseudomonadota bacterium]
MESKSADIQRALIVHVDFKQSADNDAFSEFAQLVESSGLEIVDSIRAPRSNPDAQLFVGSGKADEIATSAEAQAADVIIFNHSLTPAQERNLEKHINVRVIDRIGLILDIFAQRARSYEGKLQVELAQLEHLSTRLIRGWTHLERQKGGIGLRGPGETQLETDRRLIGARIKLIKRRLQKVHKQRDLSRQQRKKNDIPVVSLVGYTNAGKSTLFNYLTGANVEAANQLFATLDPTLRRMEVATGRDIILTDTVGFIRDLPHELVESFQATLDEVREADLLIHVIDVDNEQRQQRIDDVNQVISLIGATEVTQIEVYNKIDNYPEIGPRIELSDNGLNSRIWLSSHTGKGIEYLKEEIARQINQHRQAHYLNIPVTAGQLRAKLFDIGAVRHEDVNEKGGWTMEIELEEFRLHKLCEEARLDISQLRLQ